jgi:hypothetical protein
MCEFTQQVEGTKEPEATRKKSKSFIAFYAKIISRIKRQGCVLTNRNNAENTNAL